MITLTDEGEFLLQEGSWILNAVQDLESRVRNIPKLDNNIRLAVDTFFPLETLTQDIQTIFSIARTPISRCSGKR